MTTLVLGPILRHTDANSATIWLQTDAACEVEVLGTHERTWSIAGSHFALVTVTGLVPGQEHRYEVRIGGDLVWPVADSEFPASTIRLPEEGGPLSIAFGSCRVTRPHEPPDVLRAHQHPRGQGIDALRAYALRAARDGRGALADMLLMLGDQIYADQPSPALRKLIDSRERQARPPITCSPIFLSTRSRIARHGASPRSAGCCRRSRRR